jgi:hypothetical protein
MDKAEDIKDTVSETIESIKTIGSLNIDRLLPRDTDVNLSKKPEEISVDEEDLSIQPPQDPENLPKKPKRFFKRK